MGVLMILTLDDLRYVIPKESLCLTEEDYAFMREMVVKYIEDHDELYYEVTDEITGEKIKKISAYESFFLKHANVDYSEHNIFKKVATFLKSTLNHHDYKYVYSYSQVARVNGTLPKHVDFRSCVLTIPLENINDPCHWYNSTGKEIAKYYYQGPSLLNTHVPHGCPENTGKRIFFHIGGFTVKEPFPILIKKILG
jgi:hypothetical protein